MKTEISFDPNRMGHYLKVFMSDEEVRESTAIIEVTQRIVKELADAWLEKYATELIDSIDSQAINAELRRMVAARMMSK